MAQDETTPEQFIEAWPLYTRSDIEGFEPPRSISRMCEHCGKETTWGLLSSNDVSWRDVSNLDFGSSVYKCELQDELVSHIPET
jgi:hypothetical protein